MNKRGIIGIALLVIAIGVFYFNFNEIVENCTISDDYNLQLVDSHDIVFKDDEYDIDGIDAFLVYDLGIERTLYNGKIYLENATERNINVQIFYASEGANFCEENSYFTYIESGSDELILQLKNIKVRYLRVDFCEPENTSVTFIEKITVAEKNILNILKAFVSSYNLNRLLLICGVLLTLYILNKKRHTIKIILEKHPYCTAFIGIFACTTFLYWNYITGKVYYIFADIANDSLFQTYPSLLYLARRIQNGNLGSTFSFSTGLGSSMGSVIPGLDNWVAFFGEEYVAYLLGISQWLKVSLSGCFAYLFSRCYGNRQKVSFLIALAYAFNAYIIIRGAWVSYPNIALLLIVWMTAYEFYHQKQNAIYLPIATLLFFYSIGIYQKVFWGVVLAIYIVFRILSENKLSKSVFFRLCKAEILYLVVIFFGMWNSISDGLKSITSSERFKMGVTQFEEAATTNIFTSFEDILTGFLRTVGMTINGITEDYVGTYNYLAAPAFYSGILVLLLIPFSIYNMPKRKRNAYLLGCLAVIVYIFIIPIRRIANGFADDSYRLSSLWIIAFMIIIAMSGFKALFSSKEDIGSKSQTVFNITVGIVLVGLVLSLALGYVTRFDSWILSAGFVIVYAVAMNATLAGWLDRERIITVLIVCMMFEVNVLSWEAINDRPVVTKQQLEQKEFYNSSSLDAVNYLKTNDTNWHRLEKKSGEVFMCDAWAQDYYGTVSYIGGTGISSNIQNIYRTLGLPLQETRVMLGSGGNIGIDALWGVKYFLNKENVPIDVYGLTYLKTVGDIDIYKNELALPLAYTYDQSISYDNFLKYPMAERRNIMLRNCVLEETEMETHIAEKSCELMEVCAEKVDGRYCLQLPKNSVLVIKLEAKESNFGALYSIDTNNSVAHRYFNLTKGEECVIEICMDDFAAVWFATEDNIQNLQFYYQDADIYYADTIEAIEDLRKNTLMVNEFDENYISGEIYCENDTILATSIPYDTNWEIYVDDEIVESQNVNIGFLGAELEKGGHKVKFIYKTETWAQNNRYMLIWGMIAVALTACEAYRKRKLPLKH